MKKNKKTTDSILKDIFDPIQAAQEKATHPLTDFSTPTAQPVNRVKPWIEEAPIVVESLPIVEAVLPIPEVSRLIEEITAASPIQQTQDDSEKSIRVLNFIAVIVGVAALAAALLILGLLWQAANREARPPKISTAVTNPVLLKIDRLNHEGIRFKNHSIKNNKLMLRGFAAKQSFVVQFVAAINHSSYFKNALISSMQEVRTGTSVKNYEFQIYADVIA